MENWHRCEKMKGHISWHETLQKWYYWSEEGRWAVDVTECKFCGEKFTVPPVVREDGDSYNLR